MKAFQIGTQQGLDSLTAIICPEPVAGPCEVIVAPRLVSLISRDVQILRGVYSALQAPERIPVSERCGYRCAGLGRADGLECAGRGVQGQVSRLPLPP
jgi:NADPH:quinone reductase-like Zn-dependent oxidoreductase